MTVEEIRTFLGWCCIIDFGILLVWLVMFTLGRDWMRGLHGRWFKLSEQAFDTTHYAGMALFKLCAFLLHLVPYLALGLSE